MLKRFFSVACNVPAQVSKANLCLAKQLVGNHGVVSVGVQRNKINNNYYVHVGVGEPSNIPEVSKLTLDLTKTGAIEDAVTVEIKNIDRLVFSGPTMGRK